MTKAVKRINMCDGPIFINIIKYTIPIICTSVLQLLFNAADLVVVGRFCGSESVAAVGATNSLINLIVNMFIGMSIGVSVCVANAVGAKNDEQIAKTVHTAVPLAIICGGMITILGLTLSTPILKLMGTPQSILPLSSLYTQIYFCGMIPTVLFEFLAAIFRASGDTKTPFKYLSLAGIINVILNVIFVTVIDLDVAGVAIATVTSQIVSCALIVLTLIRKDDAFKLEIKKIKVYKETLVRIIKIGLPSGLQSTVFSFSNVIIQSSVNSFGAVAVAGNAAAASLEGFVYVAMNAFHQTSLNYTGQNVGAKKPKRILKAFWLNIAIVTSLSVVIIIVFYTLKRPLLSLYLSDSPESVAFGVTRMSYICLFYYIIGIYEVFNGAIRGMGHSVLTMLISVFGVCGVRIVWLFTVFKYYNTLEMLYVSYPISWIACVIAFIISFVLIYKKIRKKLE